MSFAYHQYGNEALKRPPLSPFEIVPDTMEEAFFVVKISWRHVSFIVQYSSMEEECHVDIK